MPTRSSCENLAGLLAGCVTLLLALPLAAKQAKSAGEISDQKAFQSVHRYCIDLSALRDYQVHDARSFIERESRPGKLLTKIPWKLEKDCDAGDLDAVVKLEFPRSVAVKLGGTVQPPEGPQNGSRPSAVGVSAPDDDNTASLRVISPQNDTMIYRCEGHALLPGGADTATGTDDETTERYYAMYRAFGFLAQDIKLQSP